MELLPRGALVRVISLIPSEDSMFVDNAFPKDESISRWIMDVLGRVCQLWDLLSIRTNRI